VDREAVAPDAVAPDAVAPDAVAPGEGPSADGSGAAREGNPVPPGQVAAMFDRIAPVYDRLNTTMTAGADGRWRSAAVRATGIGTAATAVDVACGTGKLTRALAERVGPAGRVVGIDLSPGMLQVAAAELRDLPQVRLEVGDALALPLPDDAADAATIAFGLRNLSDFEAGFRELARVVRPGGRVVCLELTQPRPRWWGHVFRVAFRVMAPVLGGAHGVRDAYRYLPTSLEGFPDARSLAASMRRAGMVDVRYRRMGLGTVALHVGTVPPSRLTAGAGP
jgi:demethylmenaquinone methyltransferase/2-methoxy-6-polyprenyl-1,4-benzoquinol methylase